jgi:hypothetical protein
MLVVSTHLGCNVYFDSVVFVPFSVCNVSANLLVPSVVCQLYNPIPVCVYLRLYRLHNDAPLRKYPATSVSSACACVTSDRSFCYSCLIVVQCDRATYRDRNAQHGRPFIPGWTCRRRGSFSHTFILRSGDHSFGTAAKTTRK